MRRWIACRLEFRGWHRAPLMQPGRFTELFFLDEATAFAAGHRPCALCRREDYNRFAARWQELHPGRRGADAMDDQLHAERVRPATDVGCTPASPRRPARRRLRPPWRAALAGARRCAAALEPGRLRRARGPSRPAASPSSRRPPSWRSCAAAGTAPSRSCTRRPATAPAGTGRFRCVELLEGETVLWRGRPSWRSMVAFYIKWGLLALVPGVLAQIISSAGGDHTPARPRSGRSRSSCS